MAFNVLLPSFVEHAEPDPIAIRLQDNFCCIYDDFSDGSMNENTFDTLG
jgi:hypothetical protein